MVAATDAVRAQALACPNCGGAVVVRSLGHAVNVTCPGCDSVLDARDPGLRVLQRFAARTARATPKIPLGARGTLHDTVYEVIGFQLRSITVDGERYAWDEYLLFNPYAGFRYLTEYGGHWNDVVAVNAMLAEELGDGGRPLVRHGGAVFLHFQAARATTDYVLGEFPWQVRTGDTVAVSDFVAPPRLLSAERTPEETTWSLATYVPGARVWEAFALPDSPPTPVGVYANQPSPHGERARGRWSIFGKLFALLVVLQFVAMLGARNEEVFTAAYGFTPPGGEAAAFVTQPFELRGRTSNVELDVDSDVANGWIYLGIALIDAERGTARDFGREVSYYSGTDAEDGAWTEGSPRDRVRVPSVPPGRYYLRIAPDGPPGGPPVRYTLRVRRDVPGIAPFFAALALLAAPPIAALFAGWSFEQRRWQESDYAPTTSEDGGDDD